MQIRSLILERPVIQAPMAGVATPELAAAVSNAGGLGCLGLATMSAKQAVEAMARTRAMTDRPFGVNVFCHARPRRDAEIEAAWIDHLAPRFAQFGAAPPTELRDIYPSFRTSDDMLEALVDAGPALISFHFGLPDAGRIARLRATGAVLAATATSAAEARAIVAAGLDLVIAQGWEAGGHRGMFDPNGDDARLPLAELLAALRDLPVPVVAAGAIMDAADSRAALAAGAVAVQCGTAFLRAPEAATTPAHRAALSLGRTKMTRAISGRPARSIENLFTAIDDTAAPDYPVTYDAGKALNAAALGAGETDYGPQWAGTGAASSVARPAAETVAALAG